jgi:hypothetical protein
MIGAQRYILRRAEIEKIFFDCRDQIKCVTVTLETCLYREMHGHSRPIINQISIVHVQCNIIVFIFQYWILSRWEW